MSGLDPGEGPSTTSTTFRPAPSPHTSPRTDTDTDTEQPSFPGGGYGLGTTTIKTLTIRPIIPDLDLLPRGPNSIPILRLITDSIAQQSKVLSRYLIFHPPILWPWSENFRWPIGVPPIVAAGGALGAYLFWRCYKGGDQGGIFQAGLLAGVYMGGVIFVYLCLIELSVNIFGGFIERAGEVAKLGLLRAVGVSREEEIEMEEGEDPDGERGWGGTKGWVVEWGGMWKIEVEVETDPGIKLNPGLGIGRGLGKEVERRRKRRRLEIKAFTVKIQYRRQGLGRDLLERMLEGEGVGVDDVEDVGVMAPGLGDGAGREEGKFREMEVGIAEDHTNEIRFVPEWLKRGVQIEEDRVSRWVSRVVGERRRRAKEERGRGKKRE
ncbi:hypothetical protein BDZ91DRAFT_721228 [Kalaharituber pfeilii]|nr:hypothetical protein BDZ91DRAFT_721228 [Kalaharituber pfeilii]